MKPIPRLADDMRIYLATEKMENQEILETLLESREDSEATLMSARQKVSDVFVSYILPAEKGARSKKLDHDGFLALLLEAFFLETVLLLAESSASARGAFSFALKLYTTHVLRSRLDLSKNSYDSAVLTVFPCTHAIRSIPEYDLLIVYHLINT